LRVYPTKGSPKKKGFEETLGGERRRGVGSLSFFLRKGGKKSFQFFLRGDSLDHGNLFTTEG